ncbi:MAG: amidohydrolase family protein [Gemmatimonadota bacterium]|jgi:predicted TIM-barrel fold metal-dependent hydrolase
MAEKNYRIDLHYHIIPRPYVEALTGRGIRGPSYVRFPDWTPEKTLKHMDRNRVRTAVTSLSTPGVWFGEVGLARRLSRLCNEFQAQMVADYPDRFGSLAFLPLPDVEGALGELEYALDDLGHDGVVLLTDTDGCYLGDPEYEEFFAELNRRRTVVFIHPHDDPGPERRYGLFSPLLEWPVHTTRAVMDLLYSGRLERFPDIRYILAHGGGSVPCLAYRIASGFGMDPGEHIGDVVLGGDLGVGTGSTEGLEEGISHLKRLFYDTASPGQSHLAALQEFVGPSRLVFGTDGGWTPPIQTAQTINELMAYDGFDPGQLAAVERDNALSLFPRLAERERVRAAPSA